MKIYKSLEISIKEKKKEDSSIFVKNLIIDSLYINWGFEKSITDNKHTVIVEVIESQTDNRFDEINEFIKLINNNKSLINEFKDGNMVLSIDYEYDEQCNLEFSHTDLKKLCEFDIDLCISCWKG